MIAILVVMGIRNNEKKNSTDKRNHPVLWQGSGPMHLEALAAGFQGVGCHWNETFPQGLGFRIPRRRVKPRLL